MALQRLATRANQAIWFWSPSRPSGRRRVDGLPPLCPQNGAANDVLLAELKGLKDSYDAEQIDEEQFKMLRSECVKKHAAIGRALMEQAKRSARGGGPRRAAQMEEDDSGRFLNTFTWGPYGMAVLDMPDATISEGAAMMRSTLCHSKNLNPTVVSRPL